MQRRPILTLLCSLGALLPGCADTQYKVVDVPFCATDEPGVHADLARRYVLLTRGGDAYGVITGFGQRLGGPQQVGWFSAANVRMAMIECAELPPRADREWARQLDEDTVPQVCKGQRVVFNQVIEAVADERSKGLRYGGSLHFPPVELQCTAGTLVQSNDHTLQQIIDDFVESVDRYDLHHEALPSSFEVLARETKAPALPPDPWGSALKFETSSKGDAVTQIRLISAGPDQAFDTDDDVEVLAKRSGGSTNITVFPGIEQSISADYKALLRSRGVTP